MRFLWLKVLKSPPHWQMSAWVSVPQHYGFWQLEINRRLQFCCKNLSQCYCSKIPGALKRFICKLLRFLLRRRFRWQNWHYVAQLTLHLFDLEIFFITMPHEARQWKSRGGTSMRASKWTLQASVLSVHCLQTNRKPRDKMHFYLGCWRPQLRQWRVVKRQESIHYKQNYSRQMSSQPPRCLLISSLRSGTTKPSPKTGVRALYPRFRRRVTSTTAGADLGGGCRGCAPPLR